MDRVINLSTTDILRLFCEAVERMEESGQIKEYFTTTATAISLHRFTLAVCVVSKRELNSFLDYWEIYFSDVKIKVYCNDVDYIIPSITLNSVYEIILNSENFRGIKSKHRELVLMNKQLYQNEQS